MKRECGSVLVWAPLVGYNEFRTYRGNIMRRLKITAGLIATFAAGSLVNSSAAGAALGFCYEPSAPSTFLRKPQKPYCAITTSCSSWQVNSYRSDIESYFRKLRTYAEEVDTYYSDASDYVQCMSKLD
jgi:hypothetical protein